MPTVCTYDWNGLPGLIVAAPSFQVYDLAYSTQQIEEQDHVKLEVMSHEEAAPYSWALAECTWAAKRPWWMSL